MHQASYEEHLDDLDAHVQEREGRCFNIRAKVIEAIKKQLQYAGRNRPAYKKHRD
jgi:hypothetical protein